MKPEIVIQHGEGKSLYYVVDAAAPAGEQPAVISTKHSMAEALEEQRRLCLTEKIEARGAS